jgi:hypothetical protein
VINFYNTNNAFLEEKIVRLLEWRRRKHTRAMPVAVKALYLGVFVVKTSGLKAWGLLLDCGSTRKFIFNF